MQIYYRKETGRLNAQVYSYLTAKYGDDVPQPTEVFIITFVNLAPVFDHATHEVGWVKPLPD